VSASQRTKGLAYERATARRLRCIFPNAARNLSETRDGHTGVDLVHTGALRIQCKRGKQYAPVARIEEVNAPGIPMLITKGDRRRDVAVLYLDDLLAILGDVGVVYDG